MPPVSLSRQVRMALSYLALLVFSLFALAPIIRALESAFGGKFVLPAPISERLTNAAFPAWSTKAALVALAVAIAGVTLSSVIGFVLSRWRTRPQTESVARSPLPQIVPPLILLAPLLFLLFRTGLLEFFLWIGALYLLTAAPVCCYQLKRVYDGIPPSVEEAATIEGCNSWRSFYSVFFPAAAPALLLTALFSFLVAWNDFFVLAGASQAEPSSVWALYSVAVLFAALVVGFFLWLLGRFRVLSS